MFHAAARTETRRGGSGTRERILDAGRARFARGGYEATSIRSIARDLKISDAAVHYHFPSKQALLAAVIGEPESLPDEALCATTCTSREELLECMVAFFFAYARRADLIRLMLREQIVSEPTTVASGQHISVQYYELMRPAFLRLYGEAGDSLMETARLVLSGVLWDAVLEQTGEKEMAASPELARRVRSLLELTLPESTASAECSDS